MGNCIRTCESLLNKGSFMNRDTTVGDLLLMGMLFAASYPAVVKGQSTSRPPLVSISWPLTNCSSSYIFGPGTSFKIKADASDPDGSISYVQFFANSELIGVVSNAPFTVVWGKDAAHGAWTLTAVAVDDSGAQAQADPVQVVSLGGFPTPPVFSITSPHDGIVFAAPASFEFSVELLASYLADTGSVEFFLGTNSLGTVTQTGPLTASTPLYTLNVTDVPEGDYVLNVKKDGLSVRYASCKSIIIRVGKLGLQSPRLSLDRRFEFDVVTSFPTNQNIIVASSNLLNWVPISTNVPSSNTFTFTEPSPATNAPRFYRAVVPAQ
jgi:hypothetical protein